MNKEQKMVEEFHKEFDIPTRTKPFRLSYKEASLRTSLIQEELDELSDAFVSGSITDVADGIADLLYVVYGTAVQCGIDIEPIFQEVHRSNMTKVGGYKREDGKWIKPSTYDPPNIKQVLKKQGCVE